MFLIGRYRIDSRVVLAPMAGVTDAPFRRLCLEFGAGTATSEMVTAKTELWQSRKSNLRLAVDRLTCIEQKEDAPTKSPRIIQIAGNDAEQMAEAAKACVEAGAHIVDINMGCPAKKVCNKAAGSALLRDENLVAKIISRVVQAVAVPVSLKIRTGWCPESRNGARIARVAEDNGVTALTVHGRTRACRFNGTAEYETIANIVAAVNIPVIANGDIDSPQKARQVLTQTGAAAVMVGRAAQGRPWIFAAIDSYLKNLSNWQEPCINEVAAIVGKHLHALYEHYGDFLGVRIARKHLKWYFNDLAQRTGINEINSVVQPINKILQRINKIESPKQQHASVQYWFERLDNSEDKAA